MLIKKLRYSGAYKMFMWLAESLSERGFEVTVCTYMKNDVESLPDNITWVKKDLEGKSLISQFSFVRTCLKKSKADLSISFLLDANILNLLACKGLNTKSIVCERNDPFKPHYYKLKLLKPLFRLADGAVYQLPLVAEYYSNIKAPTAVIPNPVLNGMNIDLEKFEYRENKICVLGRLDIFQKRHDVLIDAFAIFLKSFPDYKLYFYGDGPDENKMKKQVSDLGLQKNIIFAGISNDPQEVMKGSKMYVLTSDFEGIPNALIEAMSLGLPCISTDCRPGGARLLIDDGDNGFIVPCGDANAISDKMKYLVENPVVAEKMGQNAKTISSRFSESKITDMWVDYLKSLA